MASYERSYGTARTIFSILEIVGWIVVGIGVIGALVALLDSSVGVGFILGIASAGGIVISGLISVAFVQSSRANVDTAEMTRDLLNIAKAYSSPEKVNFPSGSNVYGEKTAQPVKETEPVIANSDPVSPDHPAEPARYCGSHKGVEISVALVSGEELYFVEENAFVSFAAAKAFIDEGVKGKPEDDGGR